MLDLVRPGRADRLPGAEVPLRAKLFSAEQMERHGRKLSRSHRLSEHPQPDRLLGRLSSNQDVLDEASSVLTAAANQKRVLTPAGEWLLDNLYLIKEQIAIARRHLPKGYSRELPQLHQGPSAGLPRVYDLATNSISHGDGRVDGESLSRFISAYQALSPLQIGELWAIPIMLRLALIENLRRVGARVIADRSDRDMAHEWADRLIASAQADPKSVVLVIADMARSEPPMTEAFVAELVRRLQGRSAALAVPLNWLEQWLADSDLSVEQMVQAENQQQAADQVSVSNSIGSLRFLAMMDWREFVESMSVVEQTLRSDPNGTYGQMDFATRDRYRHVTEKIARQGKLGELEVAHAALQLARDYADGASSSDLGAHVGYYLIDDGRVALERTLSLRQGLVGTLRRIARRAPYPTYTAAIALIIAAFTYGLLATQGIGLGSPMVWLLGVLAVVAFSELGVSVVNWIAMLMATPRALPRLDYSEGIPSDARTLVAVPALIGSVSGVDVLVEALEVRYLANRDRNLRFALLTDFLDAGSEVMDTDAALLDAASERIDALNARLADDNGAVFFLFHRPRVWNPGEHCWMGRERKRGKLAALNAYLRGGARDGTFMRITGDTTALGNVRYVITLDADTQLPRDAARELVGTLAHPLNRASLDPTRHMVTRGYGILQPRVGISMSGQARSWYARVYGSEPGIDPYTRAVSDVYQDLFNEGSFVGKGIYDVDAFEGALAGRMPDNRILSHDLIEGCYTRAGLVSDVQLYEDYPSRYAVDVKRRHRWIRGDWQLLPWLMPWTPRTDGRSERNPLSLLSRGKLADNLRRSLVPVATTALLVLVWVLAEGALQAFIGTAWVLATLLLPPLFASMMDLARRAPDMPVKAHVRQWLFATGRGFSRAPLTLATLPFEAFLSLDAIARTAYRMLRGRRLLRWNPSSEVERTLSDDLTASVLTMWSAPVTAVAAVLALLALQPASLIVAGPILALWALSPLLMWWMGRPQQRAAVVLSAPQLQYLGRLARRTWGFFETYVNADDHWLAPDNVQEHPTLVVARRTSPTNIGMALLADLAAVDFGYLPVGGLMARAANTFATLDTLPRYRGHFYNWYDTETLRPLPPHYVSTVDSGNLAGHLLTLRQGLLGLIEAPLLPAHAWAGLADTVGIVREMIEARGGATDSKRALDAFAQTLQTACPPATLVAASQVLEVLVTQAQAIRTFLLPTGSETAEARVVADDIAHWTDALLRQCTLLRDDLHWLAPWVATHDDADPRTTASNADASAIADATSKAMSTVEMTLDALADTFVPMSSPVAAHDALALGVSRARERIAELERLAHVAGQFAQMEYGFLYDPARHLLAIGYNVDDHRRDPGFYDLLASEARLCSFVAIAQGQLPQETWFALGRLLTEVDGDATLLSWSGSMFEYLMPQLVMPSYDGTLLDETSRNSVARQIEYGRQRDVPWGISESGYNLVDARMNYQYRAFGVPGLGLKRGLAEDLVIAPYASMMALMVAPEPACENLQRLSAAGFSGRYGMFEAIDYTPARLARGQSHALIRSFMAHHQGMGLLSLAYLLHDQPMQKRFKSDAEFQATLLLLQERIPRTGAFHPHAAEAANAGPETVSHETHLRVFNNAQLSRPAVQMLSNGRYHVMVSHTGGGYSRAGDLAVTRWREDGTRDHWGNFCYLRDVASGDFWSTSYQPCAQVVEGYEAIFSDAKVEFRGRRHGIDTHTEIAVSPEDEIELRRVHLVNRGREPRTIEVTSYAEVVMAPAISDELHPAFSNLFVQTQLVEAKQAIVCTRRPRGHDETPPWMFHVLAVHDARIDAISYETDRSRFIGRGNTLRRPTALTDSVALSNAQGSVLDPIIAIRCRVTLQPGQSATIDMVTGIGPTRDTCDTLIEKYRDRRLADRVFDLAWTHSQVVRRQINASQADAQLYERLAGLVLYAHPTLRAESSILLQNRRGQSGLWGQSISGDRPVVLVQISDVANIELVRQMVQAHAYWRLKGISVDLVIWNEDQAGYRQQLQDQIMGMIAVGMEAQVVDRPGGIFVRAAQHVAQEDRVLIQSVARVIISDKRGSLAEQVNRRPAVAPAMPLLLPAPMQAELMPLHDDAHGLEAAPLTLDGTDDPWPFEAIATGRVIENGLGGFSPDGREYIIDLDPGQTTPAPWSNVLANAQFGCVLTESSPGYTWAENAHEFRLTPWHNDPIIDSAGEAFYLRDDESGHVWSPTPLPRRGIGSYTTRHGFGYSVYHHIEDGIASELWVYVDLQRAVKFSVLKLHNRSGRPRRLSATGYVEWILGDLHAKTQMHVITEIDGNSGVLTARNPYNTEFDGRVAFFDTDPAAGTRTVTGDRTEFLGRNGHMGDPAGMRRERLSGRLGAGLDPCAAIQVAHDLDAGHSTEIVFRLGMGANWGDAVGLASATRGHGAAHDALDEVRIHWQQTLGTIQVETPDPSVDVLANGWLLYQTIGCRFLARSGYYQSGGAFGFRDQLQDTMAMAHAQPARARAHLLLSAAHQFPQGDVLHWWHPPSDRGVRTRCSDDYLWLPVAACRYIDVTGDRGVLDEVVAYIEGRPVNPDEESYYDLPTLSALREPLYDHCARALRRALGLLGGRGLPLIATGDWNDGMNRVGERNEGESVWLGFFLFDALTRFTAVAQSRGDTAFAQYCTDAATQLRTNLEAHAWDGAWYRRAWFDNGSPLGSTESDECRIDSIAQSWSVLSGAGSPERTRQAMTSLDTYLVKRDAGLIQLLDPPFDKTPQDPGYIRGYVPGVRENGGQYTHAAIWATMAFAHLGDTERAWELMRMINPVNHGNSAEAIAIYKVEPYVVAADVYAVAPHVGRGGWTWYTGSAGWMYRLMTESLLGVRRENDRLHVTPRLPADWPGFVLRYRYLDTVYRINVRHAQAGEQAQLRVDGVMQDGMFITLDNQRGVHEVDCVIASPADGDTRLQMS